jgi:pimeloyl-ACP methyl ester carboxylesterase
MKKTVAVLSAIATAAVLTVGAEQPAAGAAGHHGKGHYADVNGLHLYYEVHGRDRGTPPLVLLHGAFSATGTSWGELVRPLSRTRQVISVELQGHGHTADIDRPMRVEYLADDVAALLDVIDVPKADVYGYSMGAGVAMVLGVNHPAKVNKLVLSSVTFNDSGLYPGHLEMMDQITPEMLKQTPYYEEYARLNPRPEDFDALVGKIKEMVRHTPQYTPADLAGLAPTLTIVGDSDIVRPAHAVELFLATGGGVNGDLGGLPNSRLAVLPGTSHTTATVQAEILTPMVTSFLDAPVV